MTESRPCPRCIKGQMFPERTVDSDERTNVCISCGHEDFPRKEFDRDAVLADLHSEARSLSTAKRPRLEWE